MKKTRIVALFLAALLLFVVGCTNNENDPEKIYYPWEDETAVHGSGTKFSEMSYEKPDFDAIYSKADDIEALVAGNDYEKISTAYEELSLLVEDAYDQYDYVYIRYTMDTSDDYYKDEMAWLDAEYVDLDLRFTKLTLAIADSAHKDAFVEEMGEGYVEYYRNNEQFVSPDLRKPTERESKLLQDYNDAMSTVTLRVGNDTVSVLDFLTGSFDAGDDYWDVRATLLERFNEKVYPIYMELVEVRNEMAQILNFDNYVKYMYAQYDRDYTPADAKVFHAEVKKHVGAKFLNYVIGSDTPSINNAFELDDTLDIMSRLTKEFAPQLAEAFQYMLDTETYDLESRENKHPSGYSTYIGKYDSPFMFTSFTNDFSSFTTLVHELGHYTHFYYTHSGGVLDLAEVDSQGLEVMFFPYYEEIIGKENVRAVKQDTTLDLVYAIITGALQDEFQQEVYANPEMSREEINALYGRLLKAYGLEYFASDTDWVMVHHTFEVPFYYISYATSAVPVLELMLLAEDNQAAAQKMYWDIQARRSDAEFLQTLKNANIANPFIEGSIRKLAEKLDDFWDGL